MIDDREKRSLFAIHSPDEKWNHNTWTFPFTIFPKTGNKRDNIKEVCISKFRIFPMNKHLFKKSIGSSGNLRSVDGNAWDKAILSRYVPRLVRNNPKLSLKFWPNCRYVLTCRVSGSYIEVKGFVRGETCKTTSVANAFSTVSFFSDTCIVFVLDRICRRNVRSFGSSYVEHFLKLYTIIYV